MQSQSFDIEEEKDEENLSSDDADDDFLDESEGDIEGHRKKRGNQHTNRIEDEDTKVRRFIAGMEGQEDFLDHIKSKRLQAFVSKQASGMEGRR